jgi:glutaredoxin
MIPARAHPWPPARSRRLALAALLATALPVQAQYKVIEPDGRVTYTDRQPSSTLAKVVPIGIHAPSGGTEVALPLELRQVVARYPVTLYTLAGTCEPCQSARQLLRDRGIPYAEKLVQTAEDGDALERLSGGRQAPTLAIGTQFMRGLSTDVWTSYLDAAGYPRETRLPAGYQYPAAVPLTERRDANVARAPIRPVPVPVRPAEAPAAAEPGNPAGIRF